MTSKKTYTLDAFADFGRKNFPDAYAAIADPQQYVFEQRKNTDSTDSSSEVAALILAKEGNQGGKYGKIQEVQLLGAKSLRFFDRERHELSILEIRKISGLDCRRLRAPFCYIATDPQHELDAKVRSERAVPWLIVLTYFVFLLTSRSSRWHVDGLEGFLGHFKDVCEHIHRAKAASSVPKKATIAQAIGSSLDHHSDEHEKSNTIRSAQKLQQSSASKSIPATAVLSSSSSKLRASEMIHETQSTIADRPCKSIRLYEEASAQSVKLIEILERCKTEASTDNGVEEALRNQIVDLEGRLAENAHEISAQSARLDESTLKQDKAKIELSTCKMNLKYAEEHIASLYEEVRDLENKRDDWESKHEELKAERSTWEDKYKDLKTELKDLIDDY